MQGTGAGEAGERHLGRPVPPLPRPQRQTTAACPSSLSDFIHTSSVHSTDTGQGSVQTGPGGYSLVKELWGSHHSPLQLHSGSYAWSGTPGLGRECDTNQPILGLPWDLSTERVGGGAVPPWGLRMEPDSDLRPERAQALPQWLGCHQY